MIEWSRSLELGHAEFDRDHRQIVAMFNLLVDAVVLNDVVQATLLAADLLVKMDEHGVRERLYVMRSWKAVSEVSWHHARIRCRLGQVLNTLEAGDCAGAHRVLIGLENTLHETVAADRMAICLIDKSV